MPWQFKPSIPIYLQIEQIIEARIYSGEYPSEGYLPSVREIAEEASVNPNTVQRAFKELESSGLIYTQRTCGRIVTSDTAAINRSRAEAAEKAVESFLTEMRKMGLEPKDVISAISKLEEKKGMPLVEGQGDL